MNAREKRRPVLFIVAGVAPALIAAFIWQNGASSLYRAPQWAVSSIKLKLSLAQDASAGAYYDRTARAPLPLATIVKELRTAWPTESVTGIHDAALEVGTALLHRSDIEVGKLVEGKFLPSQSTPWDANELMVTEVTRSLGLFEKDQVYVFRRK